MTIPPPGIYYVIQARREKPDSPMLTVKLPVDVAKVLHHLDISEKLLQVIDVAVNHWREPGVFEIFIPEAEVHSD